VDHQKRRAMTSEKTPLMAEADEGTLETLGEGEREGEGERVGVTAAGEAEGEADAIGEEVGVADVVGAC
jgi:hypothetical protein